MHLQIDDVEYSYRTMLSRTPVLRGLSWELDQGVTGLLGPNGSGKTTLMKLIDRSIRETRGKIMVDGNPVNTRVDIRRFRRRLGIMPQDPHFVSWMTVEGTLEYLSWVHQIDGARRKNVVESSLEKVGLEGSAKKSVGSLSGGQKRRLAFACATLGDPAVLLLDEPTAGLDPSARIEIRKLIHEQGKRATVLLSTHLLEDVALLCSEVGILSDGKIVYSGPFAELEKRIGATEPLGGNAFEQAYERIIDRTSDRD